MYSIFQICTHGHKPCFSFRTVRPFHRCVLQGAHTPVMIRITLFGICFAQLRIGNNGIGVIYTGKIKSFSQRNYRYRIALCNRGIRNSTSSVKCHLPKYLVAENKYAVCLGQMSNLFQVFNLPNTSNGILRIAENHQFVFRLGHFLFQIIKIHLILAIFDFQSVISNFSL